MTGFGSDKNRLQLDLDLEQQHLRKCPLKGSLRLDDRDWKEGGRDLVSWQIEKLAAVQKLELGQTGVSN